MGNKNMVFQYKKDIPDLNERKEKCNNILKNNPKKIPIICERHINSRFQAIKKTRYLVPEDLYLYQFSMIIRRKLNLDESEAIFLLINGKTTFSGDTLIYEIYNKCKDVDGFLYICYEGELVFGN